MTCSFVLLLYHDINIIQFPLYEIQHGVSDYAKVARLVRNAALQETHGPISQKVNKLQRFPIIPQNEGVNTELNFFYSILISILLFQKVL